MNADESMLDDKRSGAADLILVFELIRVYLRVSAADSWQI